MLVQGQWMGRTYIDDLGLEHNMSVVQFILTIALIWSACMWSLTITDSRLCTESRDDERGCGTGELGRMAGGGPHRSQSQEVQDRFVDELSVEVKEDFPGAEDEERREEVGGSDSHASTDHALDDE